MPFYRTGSLYSRWDGTQRIGPLTPDELMQALSDDILNSGDLDLAMQRLFRWGFERPDGEHVPGLRELMSRVKQARQENLNRYDLGSVLDNVKEKLQEIQEMERAGIEQRLAEGRERLAQQQQAVGSPESGEPGAESDAAQAEASASGQQSAPQGDAQRASQQGASQSGQQGGMSPGSASRPAGPSQAGGQQQGSQPSAAGGESSEGAAGESGEGAYDEDLHRLLEQLAAKKLDQLSRVPSDPAGAIQALQNYEFMVPEAYEEFRELLDMLQQQVLDSTFQGMQQALQDTSPEDIAELNKMLNDLNEMLEAQQRGEPVDFDQFKHKWGHYFPNDPQSLDELMQQMASQMQAMQQLMRSLSPEQRQQLASMMQAVMQDPGLQQQMQRLAQNLGRTMTPENWRQQYQFSGDESLSLSEAMRLMQRLGEYDDLERQLRQVEDWSDLAALDDAKLRELLGDETADQLDQLQNLAKVLEDAGYITRGNRGYELTPQGVRKIGEKALQDIFQHLKRDWIGQHEMRMNGMAGERADETKPYEFGDPFLLDLPHTVMNAVQREGAGSPVRLAPQDFEVYRTEYATRTATVLMVDMSRSMLYNGCFTAAKKVALALDALIRSEFPRDAMSIIGFSSMARELKPTDLPTLDWNEYNYGTNMQHGFMLARQMLNRQKSANKQIIVITDGEPTAHLDEMGKVRFAYPPQPRTFQETLKEVVRATKDGITINTFMLERSPYMIQFINDLMKINNGRVFVSTPDRLGEYVLMDYVSHRRKWIN